MSPSSASQLVPLQRTTSGLFQRNRPATNIIVGNNETGKSTLLEAINLALKCQLGRRPAAYELHPFLFNAEVVAEFVASHRAKKPQPPPEILIELYLKEDEDDGLADLQGSINSLMVDQPGISLAIRLDEISKRSIANTSPILTPSTVFRSSTMKSSGRAFPVIHSRLVRSRSNRF